MDYSKMTLGELLSSKHPDMRRSAYSILKTAQRIGYSIEKAHGGTREVWSETPDTFTVKPEPICRICGTEATILTAGDGKLPAGYYCEKDRYNKTA